MVDLRIAREWRYHTGVTKRAVTKHRPCGLCYTKVGAGQRWDRVLHAGELPLEGTGRARAAGAARTFTSFTLTREQRHEPFTPRLPRFVREQPLVAGVTLAAAGATGDWVLTHYIQSWPAWTLFPAFLAAVICLATMVLGLGMATVCALEPVVAKLATEWDDDPVAALGVPMTLQRKCEQLGFWTANETTHAVTRGTFPWTALDYDERQQTAPRRRALERCSRSRARHQERAPAAANPAHFATRTWQRRFR